MSWLQLQIQTTAENAETLSDLLTFAGASAVTFQDASDQPIYEPELGTTPLWNQTRAVGLFEANTNMEQVIKLLQSQLSDKGSFHYVLETLEDKDWEKEWLTNFKPMRFGKRLWVTPTHETVSAPDATVVQLEPGLGFGTGTHPTTALCLQWLDTYLLPNEKVIDFGCGSGILALAALKLGASQVWAVDHDPQALTATHNNSLLNHCNNKQLHISYASQLPDIHVDTLIANILANPLVNLASIFARYIKPQGNIVLSGILEEQSEKVLAAYEPWFTFHAPAIQEGWVRLSGKRTFATVD